MFSTEFIYIKYNYVYCTMTQSQCPLFLLPFQFNLFIFQNSNVLVISKFPWLIAAER